MSYKVLDLFSGAGGLSLGFKHAGFEIVGAIDFNEDAIETHKFNFSNSICINEDISKIDNKKIVELFGENIDVIIGGPPCQGFSNANKWQKLEDDPRNKLFFEFMRVVKLIKPKAVLIENVPGILSKNSGFAKEKITEILKNEGYNVSVKTLLASDYGVPQSRRRAFFVAMLGSRRFEFDLLEKKALTTVKEAIGDLYSIEKTQQKKYISKPKTWLQKYLRGNSHKIENHEIKYPKEIVIKRLKHIPQGGNWKQVPEELWDTKRDNRHSSAYRRLAENSPSITIDTGHMNYFHPLFNRTPTVRESARLQSFPDNFIFKGLITSQLRQVGNAVPPLLSFAIASQILRALKK
jgi:DNA (cytosine-5)-methyltransferase 1